MRNLLNSDPVNIYSDFTISSHHEPEILTVAGADLNHKLGNMLGGFIDSLESIELRIASPVSRNFTDIGPFDTEGRLIVELEPLLRHPQPFYFIRQADSSEHLAPERTISLEPAI